MPETKTKTRTNPLLSDQFGHEYFGSLLHGKYYYNLQFLPGGFARLMHTVGYLRARHDAYIEAGGDPPTGPWLKLLNALDEKFVYLNNYGGKRNIDNYQASVFKVMVGDEGEWFGFGLAWYKLVLDEHIRERAEKFSMSYEESLAAARANDDMRVYVSGRPLHYCRTLDGALHFHYGNDITTGSWGIHT